MKTEEIYISKVFDNGHYMVEVKTNSECGLIVDIFYQGHQIVTGKQILY